jgi:UDP-glucose 4-epimerase
MKFVVTGGSGRLGGGVLGQLSAAGHDVVSVDHRPAGIPGEVVADLTDDVATRALLERIRPDGVVHLAAIAVPFSAPEPEILRVNTALSMSVLSAAVGVGCPRILVASSPTVMGYGNPHGWAPAYLPLDEDHPTAPWNAYALSKVMVEELVRMFARAHPDIVFGAFRPCFVLTQQEWAGAPTQLGHTVAERLDRPELAAVSLFNYVDTRDAGDFVDTWLKVATPEISGEVFFVGAADALYRGDVRDGLAAALPVAAPLMAALAPEGPVFSTAKAERLLGWIPRHSWRQELVDSGDEPEREDESRPQ